MIRSGPAQTGQASNSQAYKYFVSEYNPCGVLMARSFAQSKFVMKTPFFQVNSDLCGIAFNVFGFRVNPPDPVGDVGPNHYVEMINLVFAVYAKNGTLLMGPVDTGTLWAGFP